MKQTFFLLCTVFPLFLLSAAPEEEQYGARIYFMQDAFERGNYRDYFQKAFY